MIPLIDTHQHLLLRDTLSYRWADGMPALAGRSFDLADYAALTNGRGVAGSIFMEADADDYRAEARQVAALAREPGSGILGLVAACRPEAADFEAWLEEATSLPVVGLRRILHEVSDEVSQAPRFRENIARLADAGLPFDIVMRADQLPLAAELARACPKVSFVLDHCGVPDIAGGGLAEWREHIRMLAGIDNVTCKLSGVLAYCAPDAATTDAIRPYVLQCIESFTPDRCLWGSDWPVVNKHSGLSEWISAFRSLIADLSEAEQAAICNGTAQRVYGVHI